MSKKMKDTIQTDMPKNTRKTAYRLFGQLKNQKLRLIIVGLCIIIYTLLNVFTPYYSAGVIDLLVQEINKTIAAGTNFSISWNSLGQKMTILFTMYFLMGIFYMLQSILMASVAERLILKLRRQISCKLNKLPLRFFDENKPGEVLSRVTSDLDKVSETLQTGLLKLITSIGTIVGTLAFMFYYSWILSLIFLAFMIISMGITNVVAKKNLQYAGKRQEALAQLTGIAEEYYTGRNIIKSYNQEKQSIEKVAYHIESVKEIGQKADFLTNCVNPLIRLLSRCSQAVIMLIACNWMLNGTMSLGVVQAFFQYINMSAEPLTEASYMINSLQAALASAERTFAFLDSEEEIPDVSTPVILKKAKGEISFKHVSFGYSPNKILMNDISFTAKPGQKIAVVGSTGAGKTTLINLLMRFYEINHGSITIDGIESTKLSRSELRHNFGMVLQDTWLFSGTIAENIAYGKPEATREEIIQASRAAKADYFIRTMPKGYDTVLDNEEANLSVGQRQLLTIARVFLCNPSIIILDEATSSVDTRTEAEINKAMKNLMKNRTCFVIAHRLSTIRDADCILYMEKGNIIEQGNHRELLQKGGAYATLYNSQFD